MAGDLNHAKQTVLDVAESLEKDAQEIAKELQNGKSGDFHTMSKAIALLVKSDAIKTQMIKPMFMANLVTIEECKMRHNDIEQKKALKMKAGPFAIEGNFSSITILALIMVICSSGLLFVVGRAARLW